MKYYELEIVTIGFPRHKYKNFLYKKSAKVWLEKNNFSRVKGNSDMWRGAWKNNHKAEYAKGSFVELELEDATLTVEPNWG